MRLGFGRTTKARDFGRILLGRGIRKRKRKGRVLAVRCGFLVRAAGNSAVPLLGLGSWLGLERQVSLKKVEAALPRRA
ncbi:hypothetical protein CEP53_014009 [Fusarium sp. AF-6]|nr:hypothetical protein CEP53_014009 [Fusarium sp. AF-6]